MHRRGNADNKQSGSLVSLPNFGGRCESAIAFRTFPNLFSEPIKGSRLCGEHFSWLLEPC